VVLDYDPLDFIERNLVAGAVVELSRLRGFVSGDLLGMGRHGCSVESAFRAGAARLRGNGDRTGERSTSSRGGLVMDGCYQRGRNSGKINARCAERRVGSTLV